MSARQISCIKRNGALAPSDDYGREALAKLGDGQECLIAIKARRNIRRHRLAWAIIQLVHDNTHKVPSAENLMECAKVDLGHVEAFTNPFNGECWTRPKSIDFTRMDEVEFGLFLDGLIKLVLTEWLAGTSHDDLRREVEAIVDGPAALGVRDRTRRAA